jgi:ABC-type transport system involved in multi-copper enzyme maturation permease subunit
MNRLKPLFTANPILVKEIRSRMRGPRAFITLTAILLAMGGILYALLQIILASTRNNTVLSPQIGQYMFAALAYLVLFMVCAITPAVTAGAISSEKEKLTYEMLMATPLSPARILWGKMVSSLSYVLLLLFAAAPLASIVFLFGGISLGDMVKALIVILTVSIAFGVLGLFMSALLGRTGWATIASFVVVIIFTLGPLLLTLLYAALNQGKEPPRWLLAPSPISALAAALASVSGQNNFGQFFYILSGIFNTGVTPISATSIPRPLYHFSLPFYLILSTVLYMLSTRLLQPARRWKMRPRELLLNLGVLAVLVGLVAAGFLFTTNRYEKAVTQNGPPLAATEPAIGAPKATPLPQEQRVVVVQQATAPAGSAAVQATTLPDDEQAQIYAAVIRQMYTVDHTFGDQSPGWKNIYIVTVTDDSIGDPSVEQDDSAAISQPILGAVVEKIKDLPVAINLVESRDTAPVDAQNGSIDHGEGVIFTLGNIHPMKDGSVQVSASLYFNNMGSWGRTYILSKVDGAWQISGTTGVNWIH